MRGVSKNSGSSRRILSQVLMQIARFKGRGVLHAHVKYRIRNTV